ncbi:MAG: cyclase family protein [Caldisphaera sp.]
MVLPNLKGFKIIDLSHPIYHRMPSWPGHSQLTITDLKIFSIDGYAVKNLSINTHHGTHMDVEAHMVENGLTIDKYPLESFIGRGIIFDVSSSLPASPVDDSNIKIYGDKISKGDIVLLYTGWDKFRGNNLKYLFEWPYVTPKLAKFFVKKKIKMLGTDGLSIGGWGDNTSTHKIVTNTSGEVHKILLKNKIIILEELANLGKALDGKKYVQIFLIALPLFIQDSDGSPVRAIAIIDTEQ